MINVWGTDSAGAAAGSQECFADSDCANIGAKCNLLVRQCQVTLKSQFNDFLSCFFDSLDLVEREAVFSVSYYIHFVSDVYTQVHWSKCFESL
jgi:hypothetical protein